MVINRRILFNVLFLALFIFFLILSFMLDFFFFIPLICIIPFSFKRTREETYSLQGENHLVNKKGDNILETKLCPNCNSRILDPTAKFCAQCGIELKIS
jgi:hypothetical protein